MSDSSQHRRADFTSLWPWAGNTFLLLAAAWLGYMGWAAEADDLKTAFYGLCGVLGLLLLFGLRAATASPRRRAVVAQPQAGWQPSGPDDESEADWPRDDGDVADHGLPVNARTRSRLGMARDRPWPQQPHEEPVDAEVADDDSAANEEDEHSAPQNPGHEDNPRHEENPGHEEGLQRDPARAAIDSIRAEMARDKALRGARMTRFENGLNDVSARVDALVERLDAAAAREESAHAGSTGSDEATLARLSDLASRFERLEQRVAAEPEKLQEAVSAVRERLTAVEATLDTVSTLPARLERLERLPSDGADSAPQPGLAALEERLSQVEGASASATRIAERVDRLERTISELAQPKDAAAREDVAALNKRLAEVETAAASAAAWRPQVEYLESRLSMLEKEGGEGADDGTVRDLSARIAALEEEVRSSGGTGGDLGETLKSYLTIATFNQTMNSRVIPHVKQMVDSRVEEQLDPERLREQVAPLLPAAGEVAGGDEAIPRSELEALRNELAAEREARERLAATLGETRGLAEEAAAKAETGPAADPADRERLDRLAAAREADRREVEALRAAVEGLGQAAPEGLGRQVGELAQRIEAVDERATRRLEEATRAIAHVRENLGAITQHVARMGENYQDLVRRVERLGEAPSAQRQAAAPSQGQAVPADVEALRDALTTIIEQNRQIREQQELLSARFDRPHRVELDTDEDDDRA